MSCLVVPLQSRSQKAIFCQSSAYLTLKDGGGYAIKRKITLITVLFAVCLLCLWEAFAAAISGPELNLTTSRITVYSYTQSSGCSAEIDAKAKIYMLLKPTAVEDSFTVDFAELHSLSISGIQTFPHRSNPL